MNETLQEVALGRLCRAPRVLELLVGREILAAADELEPAFVGIRYRFRGAFVCDQESVTLGGVATILLTGVDLYFRGKLEGLLPGHHLVTADSVDPPDLVIADIARVDPQDVAEAYPDVPIVGYCNHTDTSGLRQAHAAGFDQVIVKSALIERAPGLVEELTA